MSETSRLLDQLWVLLSGESVPDDLDAEIAASTRDLEAALEALRLARGRWSGASTLDLDAVRRALDQAERQLDAARARLTRAERRRRRPSQKD